MAAVDRVEATGERQLPPYEVVANYAAGFEEAFQECCKIHDQRQAEIAASGHSTLTLFDTRSKMYGLALRANPGARKADEDFALSWLKLKRGERGVDIGTGTGMFARIFAPVTRNTVIGLDTSREQLAQARKAVEEDASFPARRLDMTPQEYTGLFKWVQQSPSDARLKFSELDYVFTFGCVHHLNWDEQRKMMKNIAHWLKPPSRGCGGGRFIGADIPEHSPPEKAGKLEKDSPLANYFRDHVHKMSFTGHGENFFASEERTRELIEGLPLELKKVMGILQFWKFGEVERDQDKVEMEIIKLGWFLSALHGIKGRAPDIAAAAHETLHYIKEKGKPLYLYWPMLAWDIRRI